MPQDAGCLHELFRRQAGETPHAEAVVDGATSKTYRSLDAETDALACFLLDRGCSAGGRVGVLMETCADYVTACLGTLKAGAAFLPLSMEYPRELLAGILREAQPRVVITKQAHLPRLPRSSGVLYLPLDGTADWRGESARKPPHGGITPDFPAFVPYTSGSTGRPKGVVQTHRAAVSSYLARYRFSSYQAGDRVGCNIFFVWEFLRPLLRGGACHIIPDGVIRVPRSILGYVQDREITEVLLTPSLLRSVVSAVDAATLRTSLRSLRVLWLNGEVVTTSLAQQAMAALPEHARLFNTYSISECHDVATMDLRQAALEGEDASPVGHAMEGVIARVLPDGGGRLAPAGTGELYVGGNGLAQGYLGNQELTAERFRVIEGQRFYATGDLATIREDGLITVKGRCDSMVKVRGYSVYLSGVEEVLRRHCGVKEAVVFVEGQEENNRRLAACVVREPGATWRVDPRTGVCPDLRDMLSSRLPLYVIPTRYVEMEAIPIDWRTGKLDWKALPSAGRPAKSGANDGPLARPSELGGRRDAMKRIWSQVLDLDMADIDADWNFFDLGGNSLSSVALTVELERVFGIELSGEEIFTYPTINQLMGYLDGEVIQSEEPVSLSEDAVLDPRIRPPHADFCRRLQDASAVFLTGVTGFLGAFLLDELLRATAGSVRFYCLVRGDVSRPGAWAERVRQTLRYYGFPSHELAHRIEPVAGDLTQVRFGLDERAYDELARTVDLVFHCAAAVNYVYTYPLVKPHTVDGTREVLKLACHARTKPVQYISSNGIFPGEGRALYREDDDIDGYTERLEGGYNQAKWVAEKLVWAAADRGLPVCIYRPGNIGHHSVTGAANPNDFQTMILTACARTRCAPVAPDWRFEMTPVDFLAAAIRRFAADPGHWGHAYHVVQEAPLPADAVFDHMREQGFVSRRVPLGEWKATVYEAGEKQGDDRMKVLARSLDSVRGYLTDTSVYDCTRFNEAVSKAGLVRPQVDAAYVTKFLEEGPR